MNAIDRISWLHRIATSDGARLAAVKVAVVLAEHCNSATGKAAPGLHSRLGRNVSQDGTRWLRGAGFIACDRDAFRGEPAVYRLVTPGDFTSQEKGAEGAEGAAKTPPLKGAEGAAVSAKGAAVSAKGAAVSAERGGKKGAEGAAKTPPQPWMNHGENHGENHGREKGGVFAAPFGRQEPTTATANDHEQEDLFPAQQESKSNPTPQVPAPPRPDLAVGPADLLTSLSAYLDWFRGNEEGRQEARDALAGALVLYGPEEIRDLVGSAFREKRRKVHVRDLLAVLDAQQASRPAPPAPPHPAVDRLRRIVDRLGLAEVQARSKRDDLTTADLGLAYAQAHEWCAEIASLFPEVA